ncbi:MULTISPECIES: glycosyltransferase [Clostridium]|uniref:glycosyltransferase n=1 Tax=Clostridium TaxID=1485 RepID=UPI00082696D8|nr:MULTISPECIES: glycosyltransferase [Clostridium]PJI09850.1 glycosyl transferase [Clostridium sp. CT7]
MNYANISAIIPTYNGEKFIGETIESIMSQTLPVEELIIIDDKSSDDTLKICEKYSEKYSDIFIYKNKSNIGSSASRNKGIKLSKNNIILFMDQDDIALPTLVEKELSYLISLNKKNSSCNPWVGVHSAYQQINQYGNVINTVIDWKQVQSSELLGYEFVRNHIITNSGMLLDKRTVIKCGMFDENLNYSQDWDLWLKICQVAGIGYINEPMIKLRRHDNNTSRNVEDFINDEIKILKKYDIKFIKTSIFKRNLPYEKNCVDYVSVLFKLSKLNDGFEILQECLKKEKDDYSAIFYLGVYYLKIGSWQLAKKQFEKVILLNPINAASFNNLGAIFIVEGEKNMALMYLKKALALLNNYNDAKYNLQLLDNSKVDFEQVKFTDRELRNQLICYSNNNFR